MIPAALGWTFGFWSQASPSGPIHAPRARDSQNKSARPALAATVPARRWSRDAVLLMVEVIHGELLGEPSAELRAMLAGS
jgi:hypothetical protein